MRCTTLVRVVLASWSVAAHVGADGRTEINAFRAAVGGVTPGDEPGYPITVSQPGSYVLTGNLTVTSDDAAIEITAGGPEGDPGANVTIDLGGYWIAGPDYPSDSCPFASCTGIEAEGRSNVTVRNGSLSGFGRSLVLGDRCRVDRLRAEGAGRALTGGDGCLLTRVVTGSTASEAVLLGTGAVVSRSVLGSDSADTTLRVSAPGLAVIRTNVALGGATQITAPASLVAWNATGEAGIAIQVDDAGLVLGNALRGPGAGSGPGLSVGVRGTSSEDQRTFAIENVVNDFDNSFGTGVTVGSPNGCDGEVCP